jgi:hypothetical protein
VATIRPTPATEAVGSSPGHDLDHHNNWRLIAVIVLWGLLSSAWGFSAGWDAAPRTGSRR